MPAPYDHNCAGFPLTHVGKERVRHVHHTKEVRVELLQEARMPARDWVLISVRTS